MPPSLPLKPSAQRVLNRLRRGPATTSQLLEAGCGTRYSARILELRNLGYDIESKRVRQGSFLYTLREDPAGSGAAIPASGAGSGGSSTRETDGAPSELGRSGPAESPSDSNGPADSGGALFPIEDFQSPRRHDCLEEDAA